jgi:hypothetical protein
MSFKTTYWLFGILLVIVGVVALALWFEPNPVDTDAAVFPSVAGAKSSVKPDQATRVVIDRAGAKEPLIFERDPAVNRWWIAGSSKIEADRQQVEHLVQDIVNAKRNTKAGNVGSPDSLGLNPPKSTVTIDFADSKQLVLKMGDSTPGTKEAATYVMSSERPDPMVVRKSELDIATKSATFFRERDLFTSAPTNIQSVKLVHTVDDKKKEAPVELAKEKDRWLYQAPFKGDADNLGTETRVEPGQPPASMAALLDQITKMRVEYKDDKDNDFVASGVTDWKQYGLQDTGDLLTIDITRSEQANPTAKKDGDEKAAPVSLTSKQTLVIAVGKKTDDKTDKYYARRAGENSVVKVPAAPVAALLELLKKPDAARDRRLLTLDTERRIPNVIRIKNDYGELEFFRRDKDRPWELYRSGAATPAKVDENLLKGLLNLIGQDRMIESFPDPKTPPAELGLDKPSAVVSFWVDGIAEEKKPEEKKDKDKDDKKDAAGKDKDKAEKDKDKKADEKKEEKKTDGKPTLKNPDKPTATLTFGKRNSQKKTVIVKREIPGEEPAIFEVRDVIFERISDGPLTYLDRRLPSFREGAFDATVNVTKVVITHKGKTTEIVREKEQGPWKIVQPAEYKNRDVDGNAISGLLGSLNRLAAIKLVAEKATPEKLAADYGLNPPADKVEITVTVDGKTSVYEVLFGKEAPDAGGVFAKLGGAYNTDLVFTLPKLSLDVLDREILDATVFKFDSTKVKEVVLRGWSAAAGFTVTLDLVRKDDKTWEVRAGPPKEEFTLDNAKVNSFVEMLSHLRADSFSSHRAEPKPEQELDVKRGGLSIKLTVEGEKEPLTLLIGKLEGQNYYAISSTLSGDILLLNKILFDGPKGSVAYFKK